MEQDPEGGKNAKRGTALDNSVRLRERKKALKGDPKSGSGMKQGRGGWGRMKAPRGCENLKAQAVGIAGPAIMPLLRAGKTLKGSEPQGRRC